METPRAGPPRGLLNLKAGRQKFGLARLLPPPELAPLVEHYWIVRWDLRGQPPHVQENLPHPSVHLVLERPRATIYGVVRKRFTRQLEGQGVVFGVKFTPGGFRPFVGTPVSSFTDRTVPATDVFGDDVRRLDEEVLALDEPDAMAARASAFLIARRPEADADARLVSDLVRGIAADREITQVREIVARSGMSVRRLQRLFNEYVGVGPKWVISRYRLHEVIERLADGGPVDWARLAAESGYFDQAHFIKDFKALVGKSPAEYAKSVASS